MSQDESNDDRPQKRRKFFADDLLSPPANNNQLFHLDALVPSSSPSSHFDSPNHHQDNDVFCVPFAIGPKSQFIGELVVSGWSLVKGSQKVKADDLIYFGQSRQTRKLAQVKKKSFGNSQTKLRFSSKSSKLAKENNIVRFYNYASDLEIGRLPRESARFIGRLLDWGLCEFDGKVVYVNDNLSVGGEIIISIRCYLSIKAFDLGNSPISGRFSNKHNDLNETEAGQELSDLKLALCMLFDSVNLRPTRSNSMLQEHKRINSFELEGMKAQLEAHKATQDAEQESILQDEDLDAIYKRAQTKDANVDTMDPPNTFSMSLRHYQKQALRWMVAKEEQNDSAREMTSLHPLWEEYIIPQESDKDSQVNFFYFNPYSGELSLEMPTTNDKTRGGILADEMGLGKTIMMASLIHSNRLNREFNPQESPTTLVIVPMSLLSQWKDEIERASNPNTLRVAVYYGVDKTGDVKALCISPEAPDVLITTYGTVLSDFTQWTRDGGSRIFNNESSGIFGVEFHRCILDEAHYIKERQTKTAKACYEIKARCRWCLTGTPIQNKLDDLFSLVHFLRVEPWGNFSFWKSFITVPFQKKDMKALEVVQSVLEPLLLRRTKNMKDEHGNPIVPLPPKHIEVVELEFSKEEREIYESLYTRAKKRFHRFERAGTVLKNFTQIFAVLMSLRQACCHPVLVLKNQKAATNSVTRQVNNENNENNESQGCLGQLITDEEGDINVEDLISKFSIGMEESSSQYTLNALKGLMEEDNDKEKDDEMLDKECSLCFEVIEQGVLLPCLHVACKDCVIGYFEKLESQGEPGTCPICRYEPVRCEDLLDIVKERVGSESKMMSRQSSSDTGSPKLNNDISSSPSEKSMVKLRRNNNVRFRTSVKLNALIQDIKRIRLNDPDAKVVVFSQFTSFLDLIQMVLNKQYGIETLRLDGSMSHSARATVLETFKTQDTPIKTNDSIKKTMVFCISLRAGGIGINLTSANYVFLLDCWWNYAAEAQAVDRVHRIGQTREVYVKRFVVKDTIEIKMLKIQERKSALVTGTLGTTRDEAAKQRLEDLKQLFE